MKKLLKTILQIIAFIGIAQISDVIVQWAHLPISGSIVGIAITFALLQLKVIRVEWLESGSKWLIGEMLLFFIPAIVGIINYRSLVLHSGLWITITIICSTIAVMLCAGLVVQRLGRRNKEVVS
ncbi:CidA/LrgA family protein [Cohnella mopanensis]|uniref:CidA/LrgA family protein n=1 Tax=Cohnella mopanensis TaxID=2911966 RepID=UPI001EF7DC5D|nr:CidA/LrgA family protein [Cohnella mopanensis]